MTMSEVASVGSADSARPEKKSNRSRPYLIFGGIVALVLGGYATFHVLTAGRESTDDAQIATDMVPISARVGGPIKDVPVIDNQEVKEGDTLVTIDPADYQTRVNQAKAALAAAKAQADAADAQIHIVEASSKGGLSTARAVLSGTTSSVAGAAAQIAAAQAAVDRAQADADRVEVDLKRAKSLRKDDAIPQAQVDTLTANAAAARAQVLQAQAQLVAAQEVKRNAETRISEAQGRVEQSTPVEAQLAAAKANADLAHARVAQAEADLAQAELNLSYTKITAPHSGHLSKLAVHPGQLVAPSQTITNVLPDAVYVIANFKETQVGAMRPGQPAEVSVDAYPGRVFHATVQSVAHGTGAQFSLLPPDNASGNFVRVVQRVPVKLTFTDLPTDVHLQSGLSLDVTVSLR